MVMSMHMLRLNQASPALDIPTGRLKMDLLLPRRKKEKVLIVMGATGTGKSRLSIDLATRFPAEIINSDKMQVHEGLDIVTNKITNEEQRGIPHHLLGVLNPTSDFPATSFCHMASLAINSIFSRDRLPIIVGGSNSYIEALIENENFKFQSRFDCCFLWVDVEMPILYSFVSQRVDKMVENGMVEEVRRFFDPKGDYTKGIRRAIGVPEFDLYFRSEPFLDEKNRDKLLKQAIQDIKDNTCQLARRQLEKICRLRKTKGWDIHRLDATEVFCRSGKVADEAWEERVAGPSAALVEEFLYSGFSIEGPPIMVDIKGPNIMNRGGHSAVRYGFRQNRKPHRTCGFEETQNRKPHHTGRKPTESVRCGLRL